jgi:hypothetical protein
VQKKNFAGGTDENGACADSSRVDRTVCEQYYGQKEKRHHD